MPRRHSTHGVDDIVERLPEEPACYEGERKSFHAVKFEEESSVRTTEGAEQTRQEKAVGTESTVGSSYVKPLARKKNYYLWSSATMFVFLK